MRRWELVAAGAAGGLLLLATYANHFHNGFHFDDSHTVQENLYIRDLANLPLFFRDARTFSALPTNQSYRPLVTATLALDHRLGGGLDPFWFHVDSFALFAVQCGLMLALFQRVLSARGAALLGVAVYAFHPAIAETVNYVVARSDILSTLGAVAAVTVYGLSARGRRFQLHLLPALAGVLAKEQGAMAAPLLFLYEGLVVQQLPLRALLEGRRFRGVLRPVLPAFLVCGAAAVLAMRMAPGWQAGGTSRLAYLATEPWVLLHYACMFVLPVQLSADSDWAPLAHPFELRALLGYAFVAALLRLAWGMSERAETRPAALGLLWFLVALLPTSSVIPLAEVMNDHRMYFPFVGLALAAACGFGLLARRALIPSGALLVAAALGLSALAFGTRARNEVWRNEETLWRDVTEKSPRNGRGWMNYGLARMGRGEVAEAERCFRRGLVFAPEYGYLHLNLAIAAGAQGRTGEAEREFRTALSLMPGVPSFRYYYACWLAGVGRVADALPLAREAVAGSPGDASSRVLLMTLLARQHAWRELERVAQDGLRVSPGDPSARAYLEIARKEGASPAAPVSAATAEAHVETSLLMFNAGRYEESIRAADAALVLRPGYAEAYNNRCAALNMLGRYAEAAEACMRALEVKPEFERARNNLAFARRGMASSGTEPSPRP